MITQELKDKVLSKVTKDSRVLFMEYTQGWYTYYSTDDPEKNAEVILDYIENGYLEDMDLKEQQDWDLVRYQDNDFQPTQEIYVDGELIWDNTPSIKDQIEMLESKILYLKEELSAIKEPISETKETIIIEENINEKESPEPVREENPNSEKWENS